jgi:hypothetical protein
MTNAITSSCFSVEVAELLESLECFIFVRDDAEVNCREILQSKRDFITKRIRLKPSCVLEVAFVPLDNLRANSGLKASQYSTPVLGLIFLKFADINYRRHEEVIQEEFNRLKGGRRIENP